jgi:hypothetical protein
MTRLAPQKLKVAPASASTIAIAAIAIRIIAQLL